MNNIDVVHSIVKMRVWRGGVGSLGIATRTIMSAEGDTLPKLKLQSFSL